MAKVQGTCPPKFNAVKELLEAQIASGEELGASLVVNIAGEDVLDIWGGYTDIERTQPWQRDTIVNVWSSTKTVSSLAVLMLISRGQLSAFDKVSKHWPEFAANGKADIEVRHLLSHTSGVSGWDQPVAVKDICDVKTSTEKLATQAPWWPPGTASGYHSLNMGHLLGELVRRVTGKSLTRFVAEEIAEPLDADFQIGAKEADWPRITNVVPPPPFPFDLATLPKDGVMRKTFTGPMPTAETAWEPMWRRAEIGAANGHGNAMALNRTARVVTLGGTMGGKEYLSPETVELIFREQASGTDLVLAQNLRFGIGYGLRAEGPTEWLPKGRVCFWGGWGGSIVIMDLDRKITLTYAMNKMGAGTLGSPRTQAYVHKIYEALGDSSVGTPWGTAV